MLDKNLIDIKEMYNLSEKDIIDRIKQCNENNIAECLKKWENAIEVNTSETLPEGKYFVNIEKVKKRYINPLVKLNNEFKRIKDISEKADIDINEALNYKSAKYVFSDFDFE